MKWYRVIGTVLLMNILFSVNAQTANQFNKSSYIEPYKLEITFNKTTNLVFPSAITTFDRGSQDILVQKANGVENILRVKADIKNFSETNLSVVTSDGKLYSFLVEYTDRPTYLNINMDIRKENAQLELNKGDLSIYSGKAQASEPNFSIRRENSLVSLALNGIYIRENALFFKLGFENNSNLNYDIDQLRFTISDKHKAKRTAIQEIEIEPLYISGNISQVKATNITSVIVALPKFTIADDKYLTIQVMEKNGGRNLFLKVKNKHIINAKMLN